MDQVPWELSFDKEFGLLSMFMFLPIPSLHSLPVNVVQIREIGPIVKQRGSGVRVSKGPTQTIAICPCSGFPQVGFQVNDRSLAAAIAQLG